MPNGNKEEFSSDSVEESILKKCGTTSEPARDLVSWGHGEPRVLSAERGRGANRRS